MTDPVRITLNGTPLDRCSGESVAAAVLRSRLDFRTDREGNPRGMFCNMGTCSECTVWVARPQGDWKRLRACLTPVQDGMQISTSEPEFA